MEILKASLLIIFGLVLLVKAADIFLDYASGLAQRLNVSEHLIGVTVVAFGTSIPELIINLIASFESKPVLAAANIVGSNIYNICFVVGITALIREIKVSRRAIEVEIPFALISSSIFILLLLVLDLSLGAVGGSILVFIFFTYLLYSIRRYRKPPTHEDEDEPKKVSTRKFTTVPFLLSLAFVIIGGKILVDNSIQLAGLVGVSNGFVGFTILALGTSAPELATTITAARKGSHQIGLGNVLGSNAYNLLFILGLSGIVHEIPFDTLKAEVAFLLFVNIFLYTFAIRGKNYYFTRHEGMLLIFMLIFFLLLNISYLS